MSALRTAASVILCSCLLGYVAGDPRDNDWRNIANGQPIIDRAAYYDQPGIIVEEDGTWVCVLTEGDKKEGGNDERVIALRSKDKGKTWPEHVDIEPRNEYGPPSAWVVPVYAPKTKRIYAIYTYNELNITTLPNSTAHIRNDIIGVQAFRYSQNGGATWSKRYTIPIEEKRIDETNEYHGKVRLGWTVGKPIVVKDRTVLMQFTKRGSIQEDRSLGYIQMENFVLASDNLLEEEDASKITWRTLPKSDVGLRATQGRLAEEGDLLAMSNGDLYFAYRTFDGYINVGISHDGGETFSEPEYAIYSRQPGMGTAPVAFLKNPNGPITPRKMADGKYLILFYNNGDNEYWLHHNQSLASTWRNPYWISGGVEIDGIGQPNIVWSQPEILLYTTKNIGHGIGYPDIFQDQDHLYYVAETNKETGRIHHIPSTLIENLWKQSSMAEVTKRGLAEIYTADNKANFFDAPRFPSVQDHASMTMEFWIEHINHTIPANTPLSCTESCQECNEDLKSIAVNINSTGVWLRVDTAYFHSDALRFDVRSKRTFSHIVIVMDGSAGVMMFLNNGILSDGLQLRKYGWYFLDPLLQVPPVTSCILDYDAHVTMRYYSVALTTSEIVGNFNAGPPSS
eukprot:scpid44908/ scgid27254/ 